MNNLTPAAPTDASTRLYALGDAGLVVEFGEQIERRTHQRIQAFCACLAGHPFPGLLEYVPAFTTVTVYYNPWTVSQEGLLNPYETVAGLLQNLLQHAHQQPTATVPKLVEIPVCYGGAHGPDLDWVARHVHRRPAEVVALHADATYWVYMIGFAPGFPYLGGLNEQLAAPRKDTPRPLVPAGSVGIGGPQTGVYPLPTPGGWQLVGRTPLRLFDPRREAPSLLSAGDQVRFVPISPPEYARRQEHES